MEKHYIDGTEPTILPHYCAGPCRQGRDPCPCPYECQRPEDDDEPPMGWMAVLFAVSAVILCFLLQVAL